MTGRTTIRLPDDLLLRAKHKAAADGRTLTSLIEEGLRLVVNEKRRKTTAKPAQLPVSKATGGLLPGVDITRFSDIQGADDIEYMARSQRTK